MIVLFDFLWVRMYVYEAMYMEVWMWWLDVQVLGSVQVC
jgi:hypothetical protein